MSGHVEQSPPVAVPGVAGAHEWVIADLKVNYQLPLELFAAMEVRVRARERVGYERYGQFLQPGNGRDVMRDVWEETVDQVAYLATAVREGHSVEDLYRKAVDLMLDVVVYMDGVSG